MKPLRVLFVCTGNICRSPTAHALLLHQAQARGWPVEVDSAALSNEEWGRPIDPRAEAELRRRAVPVPAHRARQVRAADFSRFDWLIGMTAQHCDGLRRLAPSDGADGVGGGEGAVRIALLLDFAPGHAGADVPDPWYGGQQDFVRAFDLIEQGVSGWLAQWRSAA